MATKKKTAKKAASKQVSLAKDAPACALDPIRAGNTVLIRTVTTYLLGKVEYADATSIVLSDAGWVADTGRFGECLRTGKLNEYERSHDGIAHVGRGAIADAWNWAHPIPQQSI